MVGDSPKFVEMSSALIKINCYKYPWKGNVKRRLDFRTGLDKTFVRYQWKLTSDKQILYYGCPTGQVKKSDSQTCRYDGQIYFHWYKILGLLYKIVLFNLQYVHNLFWLKLKWNARSKLFYWYHLSCIDKLKVAISEML